MTPTAPPPAQTPLPVVDPADLPDLDQFVTEDDTPVDNLYVEKLQRLLTEPLYSCWPGPGDDRTFLALANVGLFYSNSEPPLVPDTMLSLDVPADLRPRSKEHRSYFTWVMNKPPDVVIEIVSDTRGGEDGEKKRMYAKLGIPYYVIYDPENHLNQGVLRAFTRPGTRYVPIDPKWFEEIGLGLRFWDGEYEGQQERWLRWCDADGRVIPTGKERVVEQQQRTDEQQQRTDEQQQRAESAEARIARLEAQVRELGQQPRNGG